MVEHGGISPDCFEILLDQAGVQVPEETRVSMGRADPHRHSGVQTQTRSAAVEVGVQAIEVETTVSVADLEFDLEFDLEMLTEVQKADGAVKRGSRQYAREMVREFAREMVSEGMELVEIEHEMDLIARDSMIDLEFRNGGRDDAARC